MKKKTPVKTQISVAGCASRPVASAVGSAPVKEVWRWGSDNLLPYALSMLSRTSTIHRRIINDKADYISGSGLSADEGVHGLREFIACANGDEQTLRGIIQRIAFDRCLFRNAFLEIVTDRERSFLSLYHQDASRCRISRDGRQVVMHHDWTRFRPSEAVTLPLYPYFGKQEDGTWRAVFHYKEYEPMFEHYGVPKYIAGLGASAILYKTDRWNLSRLDNAFQLSGVMILDGDMESEEEAAEVARMAQERFSGNPGQVMFLVKNGAESDATKFVPVTTQNDGDWKALHEQAVSDTIVAHSWFRTLSGMEYASGFSADRVRHEYNITLNTLIRVEQQELIEPVKIVIEDILGVSAASLAFVNVPPFEVKPAYMKVWEARKADGYDYDPEDPAQQLFIGQLETQRTWNT